jgi:hypothetical protein
VSHAFAKSADRHLLANNSMQRMALRAAADAKRYATRLQRDHEGNIGTSMTQHHYCPVEGLQLAPQVFAST